MSFFNNNQNETVRQTLERVMREKGMWQEPKVMHTEIGDFHYYNDNNMADNSGENNNAGLPSDYLQNNNSAGGYNQSGINGNNNDFGATNNFGTTSNFNTGTNFGATSPQNQTPTPWSYGSSSSTAPTSWNNNQPTAFNAAEETYQVPTSQSFGGYNSVEAQQRAQELQAQRNRENQQLTDLMDTMYGMNRTINGMTFGGLDYLGQKLGFDSQMNNYLQMKSPEDRELFRNAGQLAELGGGTLTGGALAKAGLEPFIAWNGRRNLINQLSNGANFRDVRYRNILDDYRNTLNNKRQEVNQPLMQNNRMYIPANVVPKIYNKRVKNDGMTPEDVANSIDNAIYSPNSAIFQTKYNQNQALVNSSGNKLDIGFVSVNPSKPNQNVIKSDYQIKIDDLYRTLFGPK